MPKRARCPFGKEIEKRLIDIDQSKKWLVYEVRRDTGKYFDASYLQKILTGKVRNSSIISSICRILNIKELN